MHELNKKEIDFDKKRLPEKKKDKGLILCVGLLCLLTVQSNSQLHCNRFYENKINALIKIYF